MNQKFLSFAVLIIPLLLSFICSCKKEMQNEPLEPISIIHPDSSVVRLFPGDNLSMEIKFTTDRPINWIKGIYDIDSFNTTGYIATYPDTAFFVKLDTIDPRVNLYTYTGSYHVPDSLNPYDVIRFRVSFEAGKTTHTTGQNYPAGIVGAAKEFRIDVR
jgi:hypothetical protein